MFIQDRRFMEVEGPSNASNQYKVVGFPISESSQTINTKPRSALGLWMQNESIASSWSGP